MARVVLIENAGPVRGQRASLRPLTASRRASVRGFGKSGAEWLFDSAPAAGRISFATEKLARSTDRTIGNVQLEIEVGDD